MNRAELIEALAQHYDGNRAEATKALNAVVRTITLSAAAGQKVTITGFGAFEKVDRPARMVRNPRTGERKEAPPTSVPRFRPGTELKAYVAGDRALPGAAAPAPARRATARGNGAGRATAAAAEVSTVASPAGTNGRNADPAKKSQAKQDDKSRKRNDKAKVDKSKDKSKVDKAKVDKSKVDKSKVDKSKKKDGKKSKARS